MKWVGLSGLGCVWVSCWCRMGFVWVLRGCHLGVVWVLCGCHVGVVWVLYGCCVDHVWVSYAPPPPNHKWVGCVTLVILCPSGVLR